TTGGASLVQTASLFQSHSEIVVANGELWVELNGLAESGDRITWLSLPHQVDAEVVVRIGKVRVDLERVAVGSDCLVRSPCTRESVAEVEEGACLFRVQTDNLLRGRDGFLLPALGD